MPSFRRLRRAISHKNAARTGALVDSGPGWQVVNTFELCEAILKNLPRRDLLLQLQCVCRAVRQTVSESSVLQERLFLRASPTTDLKLWTIDAHDTILTGDAAVRFQASHGPPPTYMGQTAPAYAYNPLLLRKHSRYDNHPTFIHIHNYARDDVYVNYLYPLSQRICRASSFASCESMYLLQPPVTEISLHLHFAGSDEHERTYRRALTNANGITFGDVLAMLSGIRTYRSLRLVALELLAPGTLVAPAQKEFVERLGVVKAECDPWARGNDVDRASYDVDYARSRRNKRWWEWQQSEPWASAPTVE